LLVVIVGASVGAMLVFKDSTVSENLPLPDKPSIAVLPFTKMSGAWSRWLHELRQGRRASS